MRHVRGRLALAAVVAAMAQGLVARAQIEPPATRPAARDAQPVPVKEVVLYTSGVGYFEHFGAVKGDGFTELHFKTAQINDILKSLLLEDLDGGKVASVTYGSQEPLSHTLKSFEVDLSGAPSLNELLAQLRGASVTASLTHGDVRGKVLSVEKKQKPIGDKGVQDVWVLNLLLEGGTIRPIALEDVSELKLDDPKLQQELAKALSAVAASRDQESKPLSIRFTGQGERRVRIGYVVEAPVWKTSYRLVLGNEAKNEQPATQPTQPTAGDPAAAAHQGGNLQGWAIVENQTDSDWENVQLSLVSGRPISFIEDLYQPLFVTRPRVEPELYASLRPHNYDQGLAEREQLNENDKLLEKRAATDELRRGRGTGEDRAAGKNAFALAAAPPGAVAQQEALKAIDPTASVSAAASGAGVGEFFQYTVGDVTLPRQKSAMIPIVTDAVKVNRLSIYNESVLADHPLLGVRLVNTTGKLLPQGPITVLDGGAYAGDATIEDLPTHQSRLLSYGIDQTLLVHVKYDTSPVTLVTGKIVKGVLELTHKQVSSRSYVADNKGAADRTLLIEHPRNFGLGSGGRLVEPKQPMESTDTLYRFEAIVPSGKTQTLTVKEERVFGQNFAILPLDVARLEVYQRMGALPAGVKKALAEAGKLKSAEVDTARLISERQRSIAEITEEQNRIRENMKAVSQSSDYYQRLVKELDDQETQIQKLKGEVKQLKQTQESQRRDLENYLQTLNVSGEE